MRRLDPNQTEALYDTAATRAIEAALARDLPPHTLMARAGQAVACLAMALHPHARHIWIACGPGNNGGDGLVAAAALQQRLGPLGVQLWVTHDADPARLPADAAWALQHALAAGVALQTGAPDARPDLVIDALLGIGARRAPEGVLAGRLQQMADTGAPILAIDLPSGLDADTGHAPQAAHTAQQRHTLSLLTLKPGLFTAHGRDRAGEVWFDDLGAARPAVAPSASWGGPALPAHGRCAAPHASHKGSHGDVAVLGGQMPAGRGVAMGGAAVLAARAALHAGAGRVFVALTGDDAVPAFDPVSPELMFRAPQVLLDALGEHGPVLVAGCGGGGSVRDWLPRALSRAPRLVLDADGLNVLAQDPALQAQLARRAARGWTTVLTPHPLEAARLLGSDTATVMADRLASARALAERWGVIAVLKGSGSVVCAPGQTPWINATGNALLGTAGTGDVLAGLIGAALARGDRTAFAATCAAVANHGTLADTWPTGETLTAGALAARAGVF